MIYLHTKMFMRAILLLAMVNWVKKQEKAFWKNDTVLQTIKNSYFCKSKHFIVSLKIKFCLWLKYQLQFVLSMLIYYILKQVHFTELLQLWYSGEPSFSYLNSTYNWYLLYAHRREQNNKNFVILFWGVFHFQIGIHISNNILSINL